MHEDTVFPLRDLHDAGAPQDDLRHVFHEAIVLAGISGEGIVGVQRPLGFRRQRIRLGKSIYLLSYVDPRNIQAGIRSLSMDVRLNDHASYD